MLKIINTTIEIAISGLDLAAVYIVGVAPVAPIFKLVLALTVLALGAFRPHSNNQNPERHSHE